MGKLVVAMLLLTSRLAWAAGTPEQKCEGGKNASAGALAVCLAKAESKYITGGDALKYAANLAKCSGKFQAKWQKLEAKAVSAGTSCPTTLDQSDFENFLNAQQDTIAAALQAGGALPDCGDNAINLAGEQCDGTALGGESCASLGFSSGTLACAACQFDTSGCDSSPFPASGQTTSYGVGSDGDLEAGATLSFTDNGDGTITDNNTGLMWEKKDDSGGIHDRDNAYRWSTGGPLFEMNDTIVTVFLATLNDVAGGGASCFAGHCDWRIPNIRELQTIIDFEVASPVLMLPPAFNQDATCAGCADVTSPTCSCTKNNDHWTSTTYNTSPNMAYVIASGNAFSVVQNKVANLPTRAVRGQL